MSDNDATDLTRRTIFFSGHVQGVGFRYTAESIASRFDVTGFVRNLPDGRVEAVAEGAKCELDRFQQAIEDGMRGHIQRIAVSAAPATGEFDAFRIAF